jgi:hypothetical protein
MSHPQPAPGKSFKPPNPGHSERNLPLEPLSSATSSSTLSDEEHAKEKRRHLVNYPVFDWQGRRQRPTEECVWAKRDLDEPYSCWETDTDSSSESSEEEDSSSESPREEQDPIITDSVLLTPHTGQLIFLKKSKTCAC